MIFKLGFLRNIIPGKVNGHYEEKSSEKLESAALKKKNNRPKLWLNYRISYSLLVLTEIRLSQKWEWKVQTISQASRMLCFSDNPGVKERI